jgi:hypothetical protein
LLQQRVWREARDKAATCLYKRPSSTARSSSMPMPGKLT